MFGAIDTLGSKDICNELIVLNNARNSLGRMIALRRSFALTAKRLISGRISNRYEVSSYVILKK
jgi:hypothetical protein